MSKSIFGMGVVVFLIATMMLFFVVVGFIVAGDLEKDLPGLVVDLVKNALMMIFGIGGMTLGAGLEVFSQRKP